MEFNPNARPVINVSEAAWQHEAMTADELLRIRRVEAAFQVAALSGSRHEAVADGTRSMAGNLAVAATLEHGTQTLVQSVDTTVAEIFHHHGIRENDEVLTPIDPAMQQRTDFALAA